MKPSHRVKAAIAAGVLALLAGIHFGLPVLAKKVGGAETGLEAFEGRTVTAFAQNTEEARQGAEFADDFAASYVRRWEKTRGMKPPSSTIKVYLFPNVAAFQRHGMFRINSALEFNGGYFSPAEGAIALVAGDKEGLRHELTHMLAWSSWGNVELSPWFAEGQAQFHESGVEGGPGRGVEKAKGMLSLGRWMPLGELLAAEGESFKKAGNDVFYAQSASLYAWLSMERLPALERVIAQEKLPGPAGARDFEKAVGLPLDAIEKEWRAWAEK